MLQTSLPGHLRGPVAALLPHDAAAVPDQQEVPDRAEGQGQQQEAPHTKHQAHLPALPGPPLHLRQRLDFVLRAEDSERDHYFQVPLFHRK